MICYKQKLYQYSYLFYARTNQRGIETLDIIQLYYFVNIVECGCNLSLAAKKIHISQSALSQMITNFEKEEELSLFYRKSGRLEKLTPSGKKLYRYALDMLKMHDELKDMIHKEASKQKGTIRLGLPSLILRVFFSTFFSKFIVENPDIKIELIEGGCNELRRMFLQNDLDYVVLIEPTSLDQKMYEEHIIQIEEYTAFMASDHPLSKEDKLNWKNLESYPIATFNESFVTNALVQRALTEHQSQADIIFTSSSWDFLIETTQHSDTIAVLPSPIRRYLTSSNYTEKNFKNPIPFNVLLCRPIKRSYSAVETKLHESILNYFYQPIR